MRFRRINLMRPEDAIMTQRFARQNDLLNYGYSRALFRPAQLDQFIDKYGAATESGKFVMRFATIGGDVAGHIWLDYLDASVKVDNLFFRRTARRRGYGPRSLRWAESQARKRGYAEMIVGSAVGNEETRRFYEREGWRIVRTIEDGHSYRWVKSLAPGKAA